VIQMFRVTVLCGLVGLLSACVTTYKAAEDGVAGYRDLQVDKTTYFVEYTEAGAVSWQQVNQFALKRCAEIAKQRGYPYFDVLEKQEKVVFLESDVSEIAIATMGNIASDPPVHNVYQAGAKVEGKRVTYKIKLSAE
jgi:hypothetical protein